ncbi:TRAUB domain protein, partial [Teladorsagia circumcincta]
AEEDEEIYDDDDFYQVLLKELINKKSSNTQDPVAMTRHYIEMQKLKSKRARRKEIDNRASKDRKIKQISSYPEACEFPSSNARNGRVES